MSFSIGLRFYQVHIHKVQDRNPVGFQKDVMTSDPYVFMKEFVKNNQEIRDREDLQRSWFLDAKPVDGARDIKGYIKYGTYGFESNLIDRKSKKSNYKRKSSDLEEIPLYFQFWVPDAGPCGFAVFQSFQGRSCVTLVIGAITEQFKAKHKGYALSFKKIMPEDVKGSSLYSAPVKQVRLVKKSMPRDKADKYLKNIEAEEVDFEISLKAKRKRNLGNILSLRKGADQTSSSFLVYDGIKFDEAIAEVSVGGRRRTVGIMGYNSDAGTVEISDSVSWGPDGHPTFQSVSREADTILQDFYKTMS